MTDQPTDPNFEEAAIQLKRITEMRRRLDLYADQLEIPFKFPSGFELAVEGHVHRFGPSGHEDFLVLSRNAVIVQLMRGGASSYEAAVEYYEVNFEGAYLGKLTPGFLYHIPSLDALE